VVCDVGKQKQLVSA